MTSQDEENLLDSVLAFAEDLEARTGIKVEVTGTTSMNGYRKGEPMTYAEARQLQTGDMVWATYQEGFSSHYKVNEPGEIALINDGPKMFVGDITDFYPTEVQERMRAADDDPVCEEEQGTFCLYHAVLVEDANG